MTGEQRGSGWLLLGALVVLAFVCGYGALAVGQATGSTAAWWPAAGVGVIAMLAAARPQRPAVLGALTVAYSLANLAAGRSVLVATLLGLADAAETLVVVWLVRRHLGRRMADVQAVWWLFGIAAAGASVAAAAIGLVYAGMVDRPFWPTVAIVLPAHAASVVLLTPLALLDRRRVRTRLRGPGSSHRVELLAQLTVLVAATVVTFGAAELTLGFAPLPVLVWAAVRFSPRVVVVEQILFATAVTLLTQLGTGPFSPLNESDPGRSTQHAQLYLICLALVGLPLAKAMHQRDEALEKVLASERTFRRNFTRSRVPVAIVRQHGDDLRFLDCNDATVELLGRSTDELVGEDVATLLSSPELPLAVRRILEDGETGWSGPVGVMGDPRTRLDGTLSLIEQLDDGAIFSLHLVDVTEPQELQERLQAERNYTRAVIDTASSMIVLTSSDGTIMAANPATTALTGFSERELVGRPLSDLMAEHQRERSAAIFADLARFPRRGEAQLRARDGDLRAVVFSSDIHRASPEAPLTVVISATDVTAARQHAGMVEHLLRSTRTIAFVGTDLEGRITLFNTGAERMLGVRAAEATGRAFVDFLAPEDLERHASPRPGQTRFGALVAPVSAGLTPETRDWTWLPAGRSPLRVSMTTNPVTDTFGDRFGYLFVATDITDVRRNQQILVKALQRERRVVSRLKELDRAKDDFVTTVSHELRTPMSSIIGGAEMLADGMLGDLEPQQQRMVEVISRNGDRLLALADDLLLLATFDQDSPAEQTADVDLRTVVEESASSVASLLANRDLDVGYSLPDEPVLVNGDPHHLERAVTNLLTNGVKFTPDGGHVVVSVAPDSGSGEAVLSVTDTGLGIPDSDLDLVFGRFFRSATVQERAIQGSGLGLSIVKTIVESHQGKVEVSSTEGSGTTFTVTLPTVSSPAGGR